MPKLKRNSGAKKRFKLTKSGKVKFKHAGMRHRLARWNAREKRKLRKGGYLEGGDAAHVHELLPNG